MSRFAFPALAFLSLMTLGAGVAARTSASPADREDSDAIAPAPAALGAASCPPNTLPDGDACVRLPGDEDVGAPDTPSLQNVHHEKSGRLTVYDQIPRRPDRPADYDAYRYPIPPGMPGGHSVISGYDLDRPDENQRRGRTLSHVGHGGVDLPQKKGLPIPLITLEHQEGAADVVFVGPLFGMTVITRHTLREGGQLRDYLLLFGHLDAAAPGIAVGQSLKEGDLVGFVGDTGSPELVHLHLEARRIREGINVSGRSGRSDRRAMTGGMLLANETSIVCDPRNVLPLK